MVRSDLPFGSEFSPSQIDLGVVLDLAKQAGGDWRQFEASVKARYFDSHQTSDYNRGKLANNTKLGMIAYGLIDRNASLTELGEELWALRSNPTEMFTQLARHILLNRHGLTLIDTIRDMEARREKITLIQLRQWMEERGVSFPRGGKHPSIMRLWLEKAGVFTTGWNVDERVLADILGAEDEEVQALASLGPQQRAYLRTLVSLSASLPQPSNEIEKLASAAYGVQFDEKNLSKSVLYPLRDLGYIDLTRGTRQTGRGAKPPLVSTTQKFQSDILGPLLKALEGDVRRDLRRMLRKSLPEVTRDIGSSDKHIRGLALEALAFYLMRLIDLTYVKTRLRGDQTGGAEVDLVFDGTRLMFSRWQIQCKNTKLLTTDDVAREVGLLDYIGSDVAVVVSTGRISAGARAFVEVVRRKIRQPIILVGPGLLKKLTVDPLAFAAAVRAQAPQALVAMSS